MSHTPYLAVIIEGGQMQSVLLQEWPGQIPLPRIVVDYDSDGADEEALTHFSIGGDANVALCRREIPESHEDCQAALSPKALWAALDEPGDAGIDPRERRLQTPIEASLIDYLTGYAGKDPDRRKQVRDFPDWPDMARRELDRRSVQILEDFPDDALQAIARGEVDLARLVGEIPD